MLAGYGRRAESGGLGGRVRESTLEDFVQIAILAQSLTLLRGGVIREERGDWLEAAAFWRKQLANPLAARPRLRPNA